LIGEAVCRFSIEDAVKPSRSFTVQVKFSSVISEEFNNKIERKGPAVTDDR